MILIYVDSLFPFYCEFSYDGIGLDTEMEVTGGVVSCHVFYVLGGTLASRVGLLGKFYWECDFLFSIS